MDGPGRHWLDRLAHLNVSRSRTGGAAPHKPFLLLAVADMVDEGVLRTPVIQRTPELVFRFQSFWDVVAVRRSAAPDIRMPFHALGSTRDRVWRRLDRHGEDSVARDATERVVVDPELWLLLQDPAFRREMREALVHAYFTPEERIALCERLDLGIPREAVFDAMRQRRAEWQSIRRRARDSRFRTQVVAGYRFTCALTGFCLYGGDGEPMVEAAHIHQHSDSGNDDPRNGLALTPDSHWAFDRGLWTAELRGDAWLVRVATHIHEEPAGAPQSLRARHGKPLVFLPGTRLRPDVECFAWHRRHHRFA